MNNRWLALWQAGIAALSFITAGSQLNNTIGPKAAGTLALIAGAMQTATVVYLGAMKTSDQPSNDKPGTTYPRQGA